MIGQRADPNLSAFSEVVKGISGKFFNFLRNCAFRNGTRCGPKPVRFLFGVLG